MASSGGHCGRSPRGQGGPPHLRRRVAVAMSVVSSVAIRVGEAFFKWLRIEREKRKERGSLPRCVMVPAMVRDDGFGDSVVEHISRTGVVPIHDGHRGTSFVLFVRWLWRMCFVFDTSPKAAFLISSWESTPKKDLGDVGLSTRTPGYVVALELAPGENRDHLKSSLARCGNEYSTLLAIVPYRRAADRQAKVSCVYVGSTRISTPTEHPGAVGVQTSFLTEPEAREWATKARKDVPKGAMWLLSTEGEHIEAREEDKSSLWNGRVAAETRIDGVVMTTVAAVTWLAASFGVAYGLWDLGTQAPNDAARIVFGVFYLVWLLGSTALAVWWLWRFAFAKVRRWRWTRPKGTGPEWTGGTRRGLLQGYAVGAASDLSKRDWGKFWERPTRSIGTSGAGTAAKEGPANEPESGPG